MMPPERESLTLGFQPSSHGFGWVAFSSPLSIYDWGLCDMRSEKNAGCLRKLGRLLKRLEPHTLVLEEFEPPRVRRSERVIQLCKSVVALAQERQMEVAVYSQGEVKACFAHVGAQSRQEIAEAVARNFEILRYRLPKPRRAWDGPHRRMPIFDAAAVTLTHFQLGASKLFKNLSEAD